jgi:ABC-type transport system substrate-binding protein
VASSWKYASDGKSITFTLRPGLTFSDGTPLDAAAVKANWDRLADPSIGAPVRSVVTGMTSYVVVDPTTIKVTLPQGIGSFPIYLGGGGGQAGINGTLGLIASPTALAKFGKSYGTTPESTVGAGPYLLKEWVRGDHSTEVPNPGYYDKKNVHLDQIIYKPVADTTQKANAMIAGQADLGYFPTPGTDTASLKSAGFTGNGVEQPASIAVVFNENVAPYNDVRVRQALQLASNQDDVNQKAQAGQATPTGVWFPTSSPFYDKSLKIVNNKLADAQKLIDSYVAEKGPVKGAFMLVTSLQTIGTALMQQWAQLKNVSITADIQPPTAATTNLLNGTYAMALTATPNITTLEDMYNVWHTGGSANVQSFSDPQVDKLLDDNRSVKDIEKQKPAVTKIVSIVIQKAAYVPLFRNLNQDFTSKAIKGQKLWTGAHLFAQYLYRANTK